MHRGNDGDAKYGGQNRPTLALSMLHHHAVRRHKVIEAHLGMLSTLDRHVAHSINVILL
jgi:hypothetical protein